MPQKVKRFYAVAIEEHDAYRIINGLLDTPLISYTLTGARKLRKAENNPESLVILKCEVIE